MLKIHVTFGPFWPVKYLNFCPELTNLDLYQTFLESSHTEITKDLYYICPPVTAKYSFVHVAANGLNTILKEHLNTQTLIQTLYVV